MGDIYELAANHNMTAIGSADPNIGLEGLLTGGGHSLISSTYGLAADNTLNMWVVLPSGELAFANQCHNQDIF